MSYGGSAPRPAGVSAPAAPYPTPHPDGSSVSAPGSGGRVETPVSWPRSGGAPGACQPAAARSDGHALRRHFWVRLPRVEAGLLPSTVPAAKFLEYYASRLNCVEINYTFRRMPAASTLGSWVDLTPEGFAFAVKAHQQITHYRRLKDAGESPPRRSSPLWSRCARRAGSVPCCSSYRRS